jgi:hypothetical protein
MIGFLLLMMGVDYAVSGIDHLSSVVAPMMILVRARLPHQEELCRLPSLI